MHELTAELMTTLTQFIYTLMGAGELALAKVLRQTFVAKLDARIGYAAGSPTVPVMAPTNGR